MGVAEEGMEVQEEAPITAPKILQLEMSSPSRVQNSFGPILLARWTPHHNFQLQPTKICFKNLK